MAFRLDIPDSLQRNSAKVAVDGYERTGGILIDVAMERLGLRTLAESDVLDVGCGVRFAQTLVNRQIPIRSYTGIEVHRPIVDFMREHLEPFDPRFRFVHLDVRNGIYNKEASQGLADVGRLPVDATFDVAWLFSVFTHLDLEDARAMLVLLRGAIRPTGALYFTAFIDPEIDGIEGRSPGHLLDMVFFGRRTMDALLKETGWEQRAFHPGGERPFVQPAFVCTPRL